ncbi:MAG: hypothetical protein OQK76_11265 [Gammaproteobacteria bacterium]|nr:hypothetical protein [Gammaproteobacteria bacterium]MCW9004162.1 hypothetical protein [Gammaproteobacteria bacterium]
MFIRLYFLLPDEAQAHQLIPDLINYGISKKNIHAIVRNNPDSSLPASTKWQRMDITQQIESFVWNSNLILFFIALLSLITFLFLEMNLAAITSIIIMAITFIMGDIFALFVPKIHLNEFEHALNHGEVLLMIDTLKKNSAMIEDKIARHHPAAIAGGSCWTINAMGI